MFRVCNRDRAIGDHAIGIVLARVAVEAGRQIDGENKRSLLAAKAIDLLSRGPDWFTQQKFRAKAE